MTGTVTGPQRLVAHLSESAETRDELGKLIPAHAMSSGQGDQLLGLIDDNAPLDSGTCHVDAAASPELEHTLIAKLPQCPQDRVSADPEYRRQVDRRWKTVAGAALPVDDGPS